MKGNAMTIIQKTIAILLIFVMTMAQCTILGISAATYAVDMLATNSNNVEFKAYFKNETEEMTTIDSKINSKDLKLQIDVAVRKEGYFNGQISLENAGFKFKEDSANKYIKKIENGIIYLEQINAEEIAKIELGIEYLNEDKIQLSSLNTPTKVVLSGTYLSSKENIQIRGESEVTVNWNVIEDLKAQLETKVLTNKVYKLEDTKKRIVQIVVGSKLKDNSYPVKETELQIDVPEEAEKVTVHKRTTVATNGDKDFTKDNYSEETHKLIIKVENYEEDGKINWNKNSQDTFVVTYEFPETIDLSNTKIKINGKITTYDMDNSTGQAIFANTEQKTIDLVDEKDGIVSIDKKEQETEIYKGKLYANEERNYTVGTKLLIDYANVIDSIKLTEDNSMFIQEEKNDKDEKVEIQKQANTEYVQTTINKAKFIELFGEEGTIQITDKDEKVLSYITKNTESDENGNIIIKYDKGIKIINISTSKPQKEGGLTIINQKKFVETGFTREEIQQLTKLNDISKLKYNDDNLTVSQKQSSIVLKETESRAEFYLENNTLISSKEQQEIQFKVVLNSDGEDKDLYKNPSIKIKLPKEIKATEAEAQVLYGNGIEKDNVSIQEENGENVIVIKLKGEQKSYYGEAVAGSTVLVNANVKLNEVTQDTTRQIQMNYTNDNALIYSDEGKQNANINIKYENSISNSEKGEQIQSNTDAKIDVKLRAEVGEDVLKDGDKVKAGEIIKYTITISNISDKKAENVNIKFNIPNNSKFVVVNSNYLNKVENSDNPTQEEEYLVEAAYKEFNKQNIAIEAGKRLEYICMARVNENLNENLNENANLLVTIGEKQKNILINHELIKNTLEAILEPELRTGEDDLNIGEIYKYILTVKNNSNEEKKNVQIKINKSDLIDIFKIEYAIEDLEEIHKEFSGDISSFIIDSINPKASACAIITVKIKPYTDYLKNAEFSVRAKDSSGEECRTIKLSESIVGVKAEAALATNKNSDYVSKGEEIKYTITVKNTGKEDANNLTIIDRMSNYLDLQKVLLNGKNVKYDTEEQGIDNEFYQKITLNIPLVVGNESKIEIIGKVNKEPNIGQLLEIANKVYIYNENIKIDETEEMVHYIKNSKENNSEENTGDNAEDNTGNNTQDTDKYTISGKIWLDKNQNGYRDSGEELIKGIKVYAIDVSTNKIISAVNSDGIYSLRNLSKGEYIVAFEYNTDKYIVTKYQAKGVSLDRNSDAVKVEKMVDGEIKNLAITDSIELSKNATNIDLGLTEVKVFDLQLEKVVDKIIVTNSEGTKTYNFDDTNLAKVEIASKHLRGTNVVIEYKMKVKNNGEIAGYAKTIVDYIPSSLTFNSTLNKDWYQKDNYIYTENLANERIEPGETKEVKLILTKKMTESNTGLINNKAEIEQANNDLNVDDINSIPGNKENENDLGSVDVIIGVKTGIAINYIISVLALLILIDSTAYLINRKIFETK